MEAWDVSLRALPNIGRVNPGDDLGSIIVAAAQRDGLVLQEHDVVVVAQKVVSKAEGRIVNLASVTPSPRAVRLAERTGRDARLCQLYLDESRAIIDIVGPHIITIDNRGFECSGAGVDRSNVGVRHEDKVVLLPVDPDASARHLRERIRSLAEVIVAVVIADSFGSAVRDGSMGVAIGIAGIRHIETPTGESDIYGNASEPTMNRVDEIAASASMLMGQAGAGLPVVVARGVKFTVEENASISRLLTGRAVPATDFDLRTESD